MTLTLLPLIGGVFMPHNHYQADIHFLLLISGGSEHLKKYNWCKFILGQIVDALDKISSRK